MKLNKKIKEKIDQYFDNIEAEELFDIAVEKYGFKIDVGIDINNQSFDVIGQEFYCSGFDNGIEIETTSSMPFAA